MKRNLTKEEIQKASKYMEVKDVQPYNFTRELQIKAARYYYISIRVAKNQNSNNTKC